MKTRIQISSSSQIEINFGNLLLMLLAVHYIIKINFWLRRIGRMGDYFSTVACISVIEDIIFIFYFLLRNIIKPSS